MGSAVTRHREKETVTRAPCIVSAKNARRIVNTPKYQVAAKSPAAPDIYTRRKDSHDTPALSLTGSGGDGMKIQMREKRPPLPPLVLPSSSCMVRSKYIPGTQNKQWAMSDTPPFAKEPVGAAKIVRVPLSAPVPPQTTDDTFDLQSAGSSCQGNDAGLPLGTLMGASGDAQRHVVAKEMPASVATNSGKRSNPLMECSFDANGASSVGSAGPVTNVQSFLPFVLPQNMDERSSNNFIEYITQHALELRGPRDLLWFNVDYDRRLLRRRREHVAISWCPTEEIAIPETSE
ncbi:hypothetical protein DQ04_00701110, partial [Trypanosoma grayi]|uniref:hypothetical protein n=1 Tax=Trypanosoma grayi TaxID=71804 RepID=UPI0004F431B2